MSYNTILVYTDGSCKGNPGVGGWGVYILYQDTEYVASGCEIHTTNNAMELTAVIKGLEIAQGLDKRSRIKVFTDSQYVCDGIQTWIRKWKRNGWKSASRKPVANKKLWLQLDRMNQPRIAINWVPGHSKIPGNEQADRLANQSVEKLLASELITHVYDGLNMEMLT